MPCANAELSRKYCVASPVQFEHKTAPYAEVITGVGAFGNTVTLGPLAVNVAPSRVHEIEVV